MTPSRYDGAFDVEARQGDFIELDQDFSLTSLAEQAEMGGLSRTSRPVGSVPANPAADGKSPEIVGNTGSNRSAAADDQN